MTSSSRLGSISRIDVPRIGLPVSKLPGYPPDANTTATLGPERCVVVTPSTYGRDNRCTIAAMQALNEAGTMARGIAVLSSDVDAATLKSLHACGIRGVRFNQTLGSTSLDDLEPLRP